MEASVYRLYSETELRDREKLDGPFHTGDFFAILLARYDSREQNRR